MSLWIPTMVSRIRYSLIRFHFLSIFLWCFICAFLVVIYKYFFIILTQLIYISWFLCVFCIFRTTEANTSSIILPWKTTLPWKNLPNPNLLTTTRFSIFRLNNYYWRWRYVFIPTLLYYCYNLQYINNAVIATPSQLLTKEIDASKESSTAHNPRKHWKQPCR